MARVSWITSIVLCLGAAAALGATAPPPAPAPAAPAPAAPAPAAPGPVAPAPAAPAPAAAAEPSALEPGEEAFVEPVAAKTKGKLNVRTGPAVGTTLLGTLTPGTELRVLGRLGRWYRVRIPDSLGLWVSSQYVDLPAGDTFPATGTLKADKVRLRSEGSLKAPALKELPKGALVEVLGRTGDWLRVKAPPDVTGWAYGDWVELSGPVNALPPAPKRPETAKPPETGKPPEVAKPPEGGVLQGPGVALFSEAEDAYHRAQASQPPDYSDAYILYRRTLGVKDLPKVVRDTCEARLAEIRTRMTAGQIKAADDRIKADIVAMIRKEEAKRAGAPAAPAPVVEVVPNYTAQGVVSRVPNLPGLPGTHRLTVDGTVLFYLVSIDRGLDLEKYVGQQVGVVGPRRLVPGWGTEVIEVVDVGLLNVAPQSKAWVDDGSVPGKEPPKTDDKAPEKQPREPETGE